MPRDVALERLVGFHVRGGHFEFSKDFAERDTGLEGEEPPSIARTYVAPRPDATFATAPGDLAVAFLNAVRAGDDVAVDLVSRLAEAVLDETGARLATTVLEGGPLSIMRAIRLAEHVLSARDPCCRAGVRRVARGTVRAPVPRRPSGEQFAWLPREDTRSRHRKRSRHNPQLSAPRDGFHSRTNPERP